jgi:hypothetical protein
MSRETLESASFKRAARQCLFLLFPGCGAILNAVCLAYEVPGRLVLMLSECVHIINSSGMQSTRQAFI